MLRCLGLTQNQVTAMYLIEFVAVGLVGSLLGAAMGFAAHFEYDLDLIGLKLRVICRYKTSQRYSPTNHQS